MSQIQIYTGTNSRDGLPDGEANQSDSVDWAQLYSDQNKYETQMSRHEQVVAFPARIDNREFSCGGRRSLQPLSAEISRLGPILYEEAERQALQSLTHQTACRVHEEEQLQSTSTALAQTAHDLALLTRMCDEVHARGVREDAQRAEGEITVLVNREARIPPLFASSHRLVRTLPVTSSATQRADAGARRLSSMTGGLASPGHPQRAAGPSRARDGAPLSEEALDAVGVRLVGTGASRLTMPGESHARVVRTGADSPERAVFQLAMGARGRPQQHDRSFQGGAAGVLGVARREVAAALVAAMPVPEHRVLGACVQDQGDRDSDHPHALAHTQSYAHMARRGSLPPDERSSEDAHKPALRRELGAPVPPRTLTWNLGPASGDTDGRWALSGARKLLAPVAGVKRQLELEGRQRMRGAREMDVGIRRVSTQPPQPTSEAAPSPPSAGATALLQRSQRVSALSAVVTGGYAPHRGVFRHQRNPEFVEFYDKTRVRAYQRMCAPLALNLDQPSSVPLARVSSATSRTAPLGRPGPDNVVD